mmetsp:Transcript_13242/g.37621  ORF Transcript_13242/g.37621 Transcript_13242/m.37621 type:complete len:388 (+) Transcript_13242:586-1749(+)
MQVAHSLRHVQGHPQTEHLRHLLVLGGPLFPVQKRVQVPLPDKLAHDRRRIHRETRQHAKARMVQVRHNKNLPPKFGEGFQGRRTARSPRHLRVLGLFPEFQLFDCHRISQILTAEDVRKPPFANLVLYDEVGVPQLLPRHADHENIRDKHVHWNGNARQSAGDIRAAVHYHSLAVHKRKVVPHFSLFDTGAAEDANLRLDIVPTFRQRLEDFEDESVRALGSLAPHDDVQDGVLSPGGRGFQVGKAEPTWRFHQDAPLPGSGHVKHGVHADGQPGEEAVREEFKAVLPSVLWRNARGRGGESADLRFEAGRFLREQGRNHAHAHIKVGPGVEAVDNLELLHYAEQGAVELGGEFRSTPQLLECLVTDLPILNEVVLRGDDSGHELR